MKILHYLSATPPGDHYTAVFAKTLVESLQPLAQVMLIDANTQKGASPRQQTEAFAPDIVHIHTCWDLSSAQMAKWAHSHNMPVVLSPHGKLEPWVVDDNYLHEKLPKLLLYQHEMICNADAIVVTGDMELQALSTLSWNERFKSKRPWNDRLCVIKNATTSNDISSEQMAQQTIRLYRKVIDSNAGMLMNHEARLALDGLLRAGVARSAQSNTITAEQINTINHLDAESWRKLLIHAADEDVLHLVKKGVEQMQFTAPDIVIQNIDRFSQRRPKAKGPLERTKVADKSMRADFRPWEEYHSPSLELDFCRMVANTQHEMRKAKLSLRHLAELYEQMRYADLDEELVGSMLRDTRLYEFTQQLQLTLSQQFGLTEGFMPVAPLSP